MNDYTGKVLREAAKQCLRRENGEMCDGCPLIHEEHCERVLAKELLMMQDFVFVEEDEQ